MNFSELLKNISFTELFNEDVIAEILGMLLTTLFLHYFRTKIVNFVKKILGFHYRSLSLLCFVTFILLLVLIVHEIPARPTLREIEDMQKKAHEDYILNELIELANAGDLVAQNTLGDMYYRGHGVRHKNYPEAFRWYNKAASNGYNKAQNNLANMYYHGYGVRQSYSEAFKWYNKAAFNGDLPEAQYRLAHMYFVGQGIAKDINTALKLYESASHKNYHMADKKLGDIYFQGLGVKKNYKKAISWYIKAAEGKDPEIMYFLGNVYFEGKVTKRNYFTARKWYEKAANEKYTPALFSLASIYYHGYGISKKDYKLALFYYTEVAKSGNHNFREKAMIIVGDMYYEGLGVKQNYQEALKWYKRATISTHQDVKTEARLKVSKLEERLKPGSIRKKAEENYKLGLELIKKGRENMAINLLEIAAMQGHIEAQKKLAHLYANNQNIIRNYSKSYMYYYLAWLCSKDKNVLNIARKTEKRLSKSDIVLAKNEAQKIFSNIRNLM